MTNLTEQWKKGELPEGFYYVRCTWSDEIEIRYVHNGVDDWQEIIAKVPSFEELQNQAFILKSRESEIVKKETQRIKLMTKLNDVNNENHALRIENDKLKAIKEKTYNYDYLSECYSKFIKENTKLKTENKWYSEQLNEAVKEVGHLKELLTMVKPVLQLEYNVTENRNLIKKINKVLGEE